MDKHGRLTKASEWKDRMLYDWVKGGVIGRRYICMGGAGKSGKVSLMDDHFHCMTYYPAQWRNRFRPVRGYTPRTD